MSDAERLFLFIGHLYVFGEMSVQVFCPLFDWVVCFSGIELHELLVYSGYYLSNVSFAIIFSHSEVCLFTLLSFLRCAKASKYNLVPFVYLFFISITLGGRSQRILLWFTSECFAYVFHEEF